MAEKGDTTLRWLLVVIVVVIALLAIAAIVVAAITLGNKSAPVNYNMNVTSGQGQGSTGGSGSGQSQSGVAMDPDRIWMLAVGHDNEAHEYLDTDGYIRGFQMDLILEVCEAASAQCRTVWEPYSNCYQSLAGQHSYGGKGLMGRWVDACTGWVQTVGRQEIFDFSLPFIVNERSFFYKKQGASFDPNDLTDARLGFIDGWSSDEKCVARMGVKGTPVAADQVRHYDTSDELIDAVNNGEVDAAFMPPSVVESSKLEKVEDGFACSIDGSSMMTRKDNDFNEMWNRGFNIIKSNGKYKQICDEAIDKHGIDRKLLDCYL